jgi:hypothetical protein
MRALLIQRNMPDRLRPVQEGAIRDVASFVSLLLPPTCPAVPQPPGGPAGVSRDSFRIGHRAASGPPYGTSFFTSVPDREPEAASDAIRPLELKGCRDPPFAGPMPGICPDCNRYLLSCTRPGVLQCDDFKSALQA